VKTNPSREYLRIVAAFKAEPPAPDWDGRFVMTEK
jgi:hypothetical protein